MLVQKLLEEPLGDLFNEYKDKWFSKDGTFAGFGAVNDSMVEFAARLNGYVNNFQAGMDALPDELKEILLYINGDSKNNKYSFIAYDNEENKELCKIIIERFENEYLITLKLFDKNLYKKCRDTKYIIDEELKIFDNLKLKMEYANE